MTTPPMTDPAEIASRLSEAQRRAVSMLSNGWQAGPALPGEVIPHLVKLRDAGLVMRAFGGMEPPRTTATGDGVTVNVSGCWHFRLTETGLAVRDILMKEQK